VQIITAICPKCESRYQFDAALIGQKIRCTNAKCREIFEVQPVAEAKPAKPAARDRRAPTFETDSGEHQPVKAAPVAAEAPREADWSKLPPPPVRTRDEAADPDVASAEEALAFMGMAPAAEAEPAADDYTLPSNGTNEPVYDLDPVVDDEVATDYDSMIHRYQRQPRRRWAAYAVLALFLVTGAAIAGGLFYMRGLRERQKSTLVGDAESELKAKRYKKASELYGRLTTEDEKNAAKYRFLMGYAKTMDAATDTTQETDKRLGEFKQYLIDTRNGADAERLKDFNDDLRDVLARIADDQVKAATVKADAKEFDAANDLKQKADKTKDLFGLVGAAVPDELEKKYASLNEKLGEGRRFKDFLAKITKDLEKPTPAVVTKAKDEAKAAGYQLKPELITLFDAAEQAIRARVVFTSLEKPGVPPPAPELSSIIIGPNTDPIPANPSVVFAVARGVLYALAEGKGQIVWAARVGIDTASLPVRVPRTGNIPAMVLVPSADGLALTAREALTGKPRWYQRLPAPLRGQPLLYEGRIIAPLADESGTVMVIDAFKGDQFGSIPLGQKIGAGAALQPGSSRVFIPAETQNVFVLDASPPATGDNPVLLKLVDIIGTGHGPGSLRSEPVVVGGIDPATGQLQGAGYLIMTLSDGLNEMKLRSYEFSPRQDGKLDRGSEHEFKLPGWSWFAPVCDEERVAVVTDAGTLAVLGINQHENKDDGLFPLVVNQPKDRLAGAGRGQIVHAEEQGFWYLVNGELNFMVKGFHLKEGLKLAPGWKSPVKLGTPLHASQVSTDRSTLYVVTQTSAPPSWQITAVNAKSGAIVWQRPLGLAIQGDPIQLGEQVCAIDQGAGVYAVDLKKPSDPAGPEAALAGKVLARQRTDVVGEPYLLKHPNGQMAFVVFATGDGRQLNVIVTQPAGASAPVTVALAAPLAGAPVLTADNTLIMALTDGNLHRWNIQAKAAEPGPNWRGPRLGDAARAFLTLLPGDGLLVSDGARSLTYYQWPAKAGDAQLKQPSIQLGDRIISAPLVVPAKEGGVRVAVADAAGRLTMLEGDPLAVTQRWDMRSLRKNRANAITAGPFLVGEKEQTRLLVVADRNTVVCLNPDDRVESWTYRTKGDGVPLAPRLLGDAVIIADVAGRYEALSFGDGTSLGTFPALTTLPAAPAAAPLPMADKLFAPLTDGTVLLIPSADLTPKK
jgi:outer membrane protein assembly factor BamB